MATPSLAMIPSGYKASKVYSVLPESGVGDFDFTRATTATRVNSSGLIEEMAINVPRLEYPLIDGVVNGCPSLLLEPQRTNLLPYSNDFSQSAWSKISLATIESNVAISPDGTQNASLLKSDNATSTQGIQDNPSFINGSDYTVSVFAKKKDYNYLRLNFGGFNSVFNGNSAWFDLENGIVGTVQSGIEAKIEDYGNGWYRCSATQVATASAEGRINIFLGSFDNDNNVVGDGISGIYIYGAMIEQGSYPTSYIKTNGSAVTRNAETCDGAGDAATFNDSEGVLMAEISALADIGTNRYISLSDGGVSNRVNIFFDSNNNLRGFYNGLSGSITINTDITLNNKIAFKYKSGDSSFWFNGFEVATRTDALSLSGLDSVSFDLGGGSDFYGKAKQIQYFQTALTDSELEQLTSWTSFTDMANGQQYSII